jgi:hypothetical protein
VAQEFLAPAAAPEPYLETNSQPSLVQTRAEQGAVQPEQQVESESPPGSPPERSQPEHSLSEHSALALPLQEL